jgi:hypothetical protein
MRLINLEAASETNLVAPRHTFCAYGPTGSGKTTWAASFPRPVFLSETSESGYESLRGMGDDFLFEPGVKPIIIGIEKMNDMAVARAILAPHIASGMVRTIVKDSLTFYADLYLNYLFEIHSASQGANLKAYGALGQHLRDLRVKWHSMGCNVVSLCLAQDPDEDRPNGLPSIPGKESGKYGASCDFLFYLRHDRFKQGQQFVDNYELHSKPFGKYVARARRAVGMSDLPSPLVNRDYSGLIEALGYSAEATRAALPPYKDPYDAIMKAINASTTVAVPAPPAAAATAPAAAKPAAAPAKPHVPNAAKAHTPNAARPAAAPQVSNRPGVPAPAGRPNNS